VNAVYQGLFVVEPGTPKQSAVDIEKYQVANPGHD
jgi:hypothetical protein